MIPRYHVVAESEHELQNPTSEEKLLLLGERIGLEPGSRVLDVASGRGGPALLLARAFQCRVEGIEIEPAFHAAAVERAAASSLSHLASFRLADASEVELPTESYDAALCLGASFVYGGLAETVEVLAPAVRSGGHVVVGEPYWRRLPLPDDYADRNEPFTTLEGTVDVFETSGLPVVAVIGSSEDDWAAAETASGAQRCLWRRFACGARVRRQRRHQYPERCLRYQRESRGHSRRGTGHPLAAGGRR